MKRHTIPLGEQSHDESRLDLSALATSDAMSEVQALAASVASALNTDNTPAITTALLQVLPQIDMFALWQLADSMRVEETQS